MTIFDNIYKYSKMRGYSLQTTAKKAGLSKNVIYSYKKGTKEPTLKTLTDIANVLGVTTNELLNVDSANNNATTNTQDLAEDGVFMFNGTEVSDEDMEIIRKILKGLKNSNDK